MFCFMYIIFKVRLKCVYLIQNLTKCVVSSKFAAKIPFEDRDHEFFEVFYHLKRK